MESATLATQVQVPRKPYIGSTSTWKALPWQRKYKYMESATLATQVQVHGKPYLGNASTSTWKALPWQRKYKYMESPTLAVQELGQRRTTQEV